MRVPQAAPSRLGPDEAVAVRDAVARVVASDRWILGPEVDAFEQAWAAYVGAPPGSVVGVGNGTDALALALTALGLPRGSEVLLAADEGGYAATAARMTGLVPRVVDTAERGPTVETVAAALTPEVRALVVTHLHGDAVPLDELDALRRDHGLVLVEDCAQAHGLRHDGVHVGLVGDAATFSFYPTKNLGALGDAGAVVLPDPAAAEAARQMREYGWGERYRVDRPGGRNSRLDELQAAVLSARLPHLDARNERRREIAARYRDHVQLLGDPATTVAHHAVAVSDHRDDLAGHLRTHGVDTAVHYPWLVSEMPGLDAVGEPTPYAAARRKRILSLPCFPELTDAEVDHVCDALAAWGAR